MPLSFSKTSLLGISIGMLFATSIQNSSAIYITHGNSNQEHIELAKKFPAFTGLHGTLIAPQWLIQAAHMPVPKAVRVGDRTHTVIQYIPHPLYKGFHRNGSGPSDYDVMLLQLSEPVDDPRVKPIQIHREDSLGTAIGWILGCGTYKDDYSTTFCWPDLVTRRAGTNILLRNESRPIYQFLYSQKNFTNLLGTTILKNAPGPLNFFISWINNSQNLKNSGTRFNFLRNIESILQGLGQVVRSLGIPPECTTAFHIYGREKAFHIQNQMKNILEKIPTEFSSTELPYPPTNHGCAILPGDSGGGIFVNIKNPYKEEAPRNDRDFYDNFRLAAINSWGDMAFDEGGNIYGEMRATKLSDPDIYNWIVTNVDDLPCTEELPTPTVEENEEKNAMGMVYARNFYSAETTLTPSLSQPFWALINTNTILLAGQLLGNFKDQIAILGQNYSVEAVEYNSEFSLVHLKEHVLNPAIKPTRLCTHRNPEDNLKLYCNGNIIIYKPSDIPFLTNLGGCDITQEISTWIHSRIIAKACTPF